LRTILTSIAGGLENGVEEKEYFGKFLSGAGRTR
jgi:hypothetical protein